MSLPTVDDLIERMCLTHRHDYGLMQPKEADGVRHDMRQLYENDIKPWLDALLAERDRLVAVPVREIIWALERESANADTDSRWRAASALREMGGWERRTLVCLLDERRAEIVASSIAKEKANE